MGLNQVDLVREALQQLGEATAEDLSVFIEQQHGVKIHARLIPVLRASILGQEMLAQAREAARAATQSTMTNTSV